LALEKICYFEAIDFEQGEIELTLSSHGVNFGPTLVTFLVVKLRSNSYGFFVSETDWEKKKKGK